MTVTEAINCSESMCVAYEVMTQYASADDIEVGNTKFIKKEIGMKIFLWCSTVLTLIYTGFLFVLNLTGGHNIWLFITIRFLWSILWTWTMHS